MRIWLGKVIPSASVALAFMATGQIRSFWLQTFALAASYCLLWIFFIQRYPREAALAQVLKLKPGKKVEVEGR